MCTHTRACMRSPAHTQACLHTGNHMHRSYVAWALLSWSRVVSKTCPTHMLDTCVMCIFKNSSRVCVSCLFQCCVSAQHSRSTDIMCVQATHTRTYYSTNRVLTIGRCNTDCIDSYRVPIASNRTPKLTRPY